TPFAMQILRDQLGQHVFPVHRLDRPTSGVLLFALSSEAARDMNQLFIEKVEQLIIDKQPLPRNFAIAPMAQMTLASKKGSGEIITLLTALDAFLGEPNE
uniref:YqcC family protein n=1 Tax=Pseudoalteromonas nigrifaciens TaxID=28109 RepID=UPI003568E342